MAISRMAAFLIIVLSVYGQSPALRTIHTFGEVPDGAYPQYALVIGNGGVLFGTTWGGGINCGALGGLGGCGTVFALTPPASVGGAWTENIVFRFPGGSGGANPLGGVVIDKDGVLYGTAAGGISSYGMVYSLTPPPSPGGTWTQTILHTFTGGADGDYPGGGVVLGGGGVLYGVTLYGGTGGAGTAYALTPPSAGGGAWTKTILHNFGGNGDAASPKSGLVFGQGGVLYGTSMSGGSAFAGTVYSLTPPASPGGPWTEQVLYSFSGGSDGAYPVSVLAIGGGAGGGPVLYGTAAYGGNAIDHLGWGTVFSLTAPTSPGGPWSEATIYTFTDGFDGEVPLAGVTIGKGGVLYGTTNFGGTGGGSSGYGTVFSLTPPSSPGGAWTEAVLHSFTAKNDGGMPSAGMVIGANGVLFGSSMVYGRKWGTVFSLAP